MVVCFYFILFFYQINCVFCSIGDGVLIFANAQIVLVSRSSDNSRLLRKKLLEEQEYALEIERRRLTELRFVQKPVASQPQSSYFMDGLKVSEGL